MCFLGFLEDLCLARLNLFQHLVRTLAVQPCLVHLIFFALCWIGAIPHNDTGYHSTADLGLFPPAVVSVSPDNSFHLLLLLLLLDSFTILEHTFFTFFFNLQQDSKVRTRQQVQQQKRKRRKERRQRKSVFGKMSLRLGMRRSLAGTLRVRLRTRRRRRTSQTS